MNKLFIGLIVLIVLGVGGFFFFSNSSSNSNVTSNVVSDNSNNNDGNSNKDVKVFVIDSSHLRFYINGVENPEIKVKQGDKVKIEFTSSEGFHDWVVDEFNAATKRVKAGESSSVEFTADKKGTFEYYCSVGEHRDNGMFGKFIVE